MLTSTFIHASGIGPKTERLIWKKGLLNWEDFLKGYASSGLSSRVISLLLPIIEQSISKYEENDHSFFARLLPNREHWRAFGDLGDDAGYLDIETTGMNQNDSITVIGLYDGRTAKTYIRGVNLDEFPGDIVKFPLIVTYAGAMFDLPMIRRTFPEISFEQFHMDLCPTLRRIGYKGGLKIIERQLGISRNEGVTGLDGWDAVRLWREWERGNAASLSTLVEYNTADVVNLKPLARYAYDRLRSICFSSDDLDI